jgi:hypothetical protein
MKPSIQRAPTKDGVGITQMFAVFRSHRPAALRAFALLLAAALLLALVAVACDGGGDPSEKALEDLRTLAYDASEGATAKVTYRVVTSIDDKTTESEQIVVQRPPETRVETSMVSGDSVWSHAVVINNGKRLYVCLKDGGKSGCLDLKPSLDSARQALQQAGLHVLVEDPLSVELFDMPRRIVESDEEIPPFEESQRQIAGIDATCFFQEQQTQNLETELCFSDQGLTMYWRYSQVNSDGVTLVFEAAATSVSSDVTDKDFVPPYKIQKGKLFKVPKS